MSSTPTSKRIALLRGINVGGHRKVPMAELRALLTEFGLSDVATYIQSGNIVFASALDDQSVEALIVDGIASQFGFRVPVIVRPAVELPDLLARSLALFPFGDAATHDKYVHVGFCESAPTAAAIATVDPDRSPGDEVAVDGRHVHVRYAAGQSTTKLTGDYLERTLGVSITMRNLNTVRKLIDLTT